MKKYIAISLVFVTCVRCENYEYYEEPDSPSDNNLEEFFLRHFLDELKPFISPIVEEWKHRGFPENMPGGFFEHLVEKYARNPPSIPPDVIRSFLSIVEEFKTCVDRTLARVADDPALRDIQSEFLDFGDDRNTYSQREKLSMFRSLGDNKNAYSKRFRPSFTTEGTPPAPEWDVSTTMLPAK